MNCRFCNAQLKYVFVDLGLQPPSNAFLTKEQLAEPEPLYPLKVYVCSSCWLVQIPEYKKATEIFKDDYIYFSSESPPNVGHAQKYVEMMMKRFQYTPESLIVEVGSNDGYLLQHFLACDITPPMVLGIDPAVGPATKAIEKGIPTITKFFNTITARTLPRKADLICGINVMAHQPDINDFVEAMRITLKPDGIITQEFPHLMCLVEQNQFDTIYHEHYSYFSFHTICQIFAKHKLELFDVEQLPTHGGSLRIYVKHKEDTSKTISSNVGNLLKKEETEGMLTLGYYEDFHTNVGKIKHNLVSFLSEQKQKRIKVIAYGAAAKGVTLINYCGIGRDLLPLVVDKSPHKCGKFLPGSHIPVVSEEAMGQVKPDYILVLPWNIEKEIRERLSHVKKWNCHFVTVIPQMMVF